MDNSELRVILICHFEMVLFQQSDRFSMGGYLVVLLDDASFRRIIPGVRKMVKRIKNLGAFSARFLACV